MILSPVHWDLFPTHAGYAMVSLKQLVVKVSRLLNLNLIGVPVPHACWDSILCRSILLRIRSSGWFRNISQESATHLQAIQLL